MVPPTKVYIYIDRHTKYDYSPQLIKGSVMDQLNTFEIELEFLLKEHSRQLTVTDISLINFNDLKNSLPENFLATKLTNSKRETLIYYFKNSHSSSFRILHKKIKSWLLMRNLESSGVKNINHFKNVNSKRKILTYTLSSLKNANCTLIVAVPLETFKKLRKNPPSKHLKYQSADGFFKSAH